MTKSYINNKVKFLTISALLSALGILIPMTFPSIRIEPASFTLASHVPVILAMFISPLMAVFVVTVSTLGFLVGGFSPVIVLRAATHIIFSLTGAFILKRKKNLLISVKNTVLFSFIISLIHSAAELAAVTSFYYFTGQSDNLSGKEYFISVFLLVGVGTLVHSIIDFSIAILVWKPIRHIISIPVNANIK